LTPKLEDARPTFAGEASAKFFPNLTSNNGKQDACDNFFGDQIIKPQNHNTVNPKPSKKGRIIL